METYNDLNFTKPRIIKNVIMLCVVFFIIFTAYDCLSMLQSTLNHDEGIGVVCQAINYAFYCISSLLFPKYFIQKLGSKCTLVISMCCYLPYIASNLYPHWSFMVPAAVLNGLSAALLWGSQCNYLNDISNLYAILVEKDKRKNTKPSILLNTEIITDIPVNQKHENFEAESSNSVKSSSSLENNVSAASSTDSSSGPYSHPKEEVTKIAADKHTYIPEKPIILASLPPKSGVPILKYDAAPVPYKKTESTTARFFGIFGMGYLSTHMWSNVMSYFVLESDSSHSNITLSTSCVCGALYCNEKSDCFMNNLQEPSWETRNFLTGLCIGLAVASILLLMLSLDPLNDKKEKVKFTLQILMATYKQSKKKLQILLVPISYYVGMMQGFYTGEFNSSYVGCAWGTYHVSLVTICYGGACALSSCVSGLLVKRLGRIPIFLFAALATIAAQVLLLVWKPTAEYPSLFFIIAALLGVALGVFYSQVKALYGLLFKEDEEAAFGAYHVWYSLGFCLSFAYSNYLCAYIQIYLLMSVLILGMIGYLWLEIITRRPIKRL